MLMCMPCAMWPLYYDYYLLYVIRPSHFARKEASAVVQQYRPAAVLKRVVPEGNCSGYRYRVDMGRELQGLRYDMSVALTPYATAKRQRHCTVL